MPVSAPVSVTAAVCVCVCCCCHHHHQVYPKIESADSVKALDDILDAADGAMVGDVCVCVFLCCLLFVVCLCDASLCVGFEGSAGEGREGWTPARLAHPPTPSSCSFTRPHTTTSPPPTQVARGDLGAELPLEEVPFWQSKIIQGCRWVWGGVAV